jgi:hypothetical protein
MEGSLVAYKVFTNGSVLNASEINDNLMNQSIIVFSNEAARTAAIASPIEGMVTYLEDTSSYESYDGAAWIGFGGGSGILQVVSTAKVDAFTTNSSTFTTVTGLTASITPTSATSKVLVMVQLAYSLADGTGYGHFKVTGGNTSAYVGAASGNNISAVFGGLGGTGDGVSLMSGSIVYLDSPATTSSTTYQVECRIAVAGSVFVNRPSNIVDDNANRTRGASSITLMEVAG